MFSMRAKRFGRLKPKEQQVPMQPAQANVISNDEFFRKHKIPVRRVKCQSKA